MNYSDEFKIQVIDFAKSRGRGGQTAAEKKWGIPRKTVYNWIQKEADIRQSFKAKQLNIPDDPASLVVTELGEVLERFRGKLSRLDSIDNLEERKKVFVGGVERAMWKLLHELDHKDFSTMKTTDLVKSLKDANEIREKLSGDPSVIIEYRLKVQEQVIRVLEKYLSKDQIDNFVEDMQQVEEAEVVQ